MPGARDGQHTYGGQAVIEGVMIRSPRHISVAVRAPDGSIVSRTEDLAGLYTGRLRRAPVLRGIVVLYETLALGIRALTWSSQVAAGREHDELSRPQLLISISVTVTLVAAIFFAGPLFLTGWVGEVTGNRYLEVAAEGLLRIAVLVGYIWAIGRLPEIQRVFAYHGAEHRAIHAYEAGAPLTPESVRRYPNAHPRCGTSFLLTVMLISLVVFIAFGTPSIWVRLIERIALIPAIAAVAYEVLRLAQRYGGNPLVALVYRPNIWLQRLTTRDPDDAQIEVALVALNNALAFADVELAALPPQAVEAEEPLA